MATLRDIARQFETVADDANFSARKVATTVTLCLNQSQIGTKSDATISGTAQSDPKPAPTLW